MLLADRTTDLLQGWGTAVGALFTAVATAVAIFAVGAAVRAYRAQNAQLELQRQQLVDQQKINERQSEILELQAEELRESIADRRRVALEARRAQASQIFCWFDADAPYQGERWWWVRMMNTSYQPIYDVHVRWWQGSTAWHPANESQLPNPLSRLAPSDRTSQWGARLPVEAALDPSSVSAFVEFRDASEVWWRIRPDGRIEEIPQPSDVSTT